jgi:hypothetical protein
MDVGSMHGTHLAGRRLKTNETAVLWNRDIVTLGADVSRGPCKYSLQVQLQMLTCSQPFSMPSSSTSAGPGGMMGKASSETPALILS